MSLALKKQDVYQKTLSFHECYTSIQGEGLHMGYPCFFIRTSICDIRCSWCDTPGALLKGESISIQDILCQIPEHIKLIQITGGEPLVQKKTLIPLMEILLQHPYNKKIILETGGHLSISGLPTEIHVVMDIKLPSSQESHHQFDKNFPYLKKSDEIKFVTQDKNDFQVATEYIEKYNLTDCCNILFSPVWGRLSLQELASWILELPYENIRLQTQLHKHIWGGDTEGV